nr:hypothetical protein [Marseillevirus cajuinensis]
MEDKKKIAKTNAERQREWAKRNPELAKERQKEWYKKNRETLLARKAKQYASATEEKREAIKTSKKEKREKEEVLLKFGRIIEALFPNTSPEELRELLQNLASRSQ